MNKSKRNLRPDQMSVGKRKKVNRLDVLVERERRGPIQVTAIGRPTTDKDVVPWTLCTANLDGSVTIFGGSVNGENLDCDMSQQKRGYSRRAGATTDLSNGDVGGDAAKVGGANKTSKPNKRPQRNRA